MKLRARWLAAAAVALNGLVGAAGGWFLGGIEQGLPDETALSRIGKMDQATTVYDHRERLAFTIFKEQRLEVPLSRVSPNLVRAVVAIEDRRFYEHRGVDPVRIVAAALVNLRLRRAAQGGSTITQQLARQSFLTRDKTLRRKVQELILADRIERRYSKPEILELYLNKVYFGDGLYGAEAAARGYFGVHASELTVAQAALLAGLLKSPSTYAPTVSIERAVARRDLVLQAMLETDAIDRPTWQKARATKVLLRDDLRADEPRGLYFKEQIRRELVERFGWERVYEGGLRVFATIDMPAQDAADTVVDDALRALDARRQRLMPRRRAAAGAGQDAEPLQAALIALDPATGEVRAMVGGRDFKTSPFNRALQAYRQAGSAFKPFVYAAALEAGFTPATIIDRLDDPIRTRQGDWLPEDGHLTQKSMSVRAALRLSSNRAAVRLLQQVGIDRGVDYAHALGIAEVPAVPSMALGSGDVTLQAMTAAYAAFANQGRVPRPFFIRRVEDREGHVLYKAEPSSTSAISENTAFLMASLLADVVDAGTAAQVRELGFRLPAAGKTGTTNEYRDAWFVGFTPSLAAGVWVGFDRPQTILPGGFASEVAVPLWAKFMSLSTRTDAPRWLEPPEEITTASVCRLSGQLATEGCRHVEVVNEGGGIGERSMEYSEYFVRGTEPTSYCTLHPTRGFVGALAALFGPGEKPAPPHIEDVGLPPAAAAAPAATDPPPPPRKKRSFLARLFGF